MRAARPAIAIAKPEASGIRIWVVRVNGRHATRIIRCAIIVATIVVRRIDLSREFLSEAHGGAIPHDNSPRNAGLAGANQPA